MTAALTALAAWIEEQLGDELASRQEIAETALAGIRQALADCPATGVLADGSATLAPADLVEVLGALEHAEQLMRERADAWCEECATAPSEACQAHLDQLDQADAYRALTARLGGAPAPATSKPAWLYGTGCCEDWTPDHGCSGGHTGRPAMSLRAREESS